MNTLLMLFIFVPILTIILLSLNIFFALHRPDSEKVSSYECGFSPIHGQTRSPFSIQFYIVGILFLVFDLEVALIYPFSTTIYQIGNYGFWIVFIFFIVLTIGFVYELGSNALKFNSNPQTRRSNQHIS